MFFSSSVCRTTREKQRCFIQINKIEINNWTNKSDGKPPVINNSLLYTVYAPLRGLSWREINESYLCSASVVWNGGMYFRILCTADRAGTAFGERIKKKKSTFQISSALNLWQEVWYFSSEKIRTFGNSLFTYTFTLIKITD